ncbi:MAG: hypothetical protein ACSLFC_08925 [Desulfuromonadales bacterium]
MYQESLKRLVIFIFLILAGFSLAACGGGGGSDDAPSDVGSATTPSLQSSTVTGVLTTQSSAVSRFFDLITPTSAIAVVPATIYLDDSSTPVFPNAQDRFTISNVANGDHSLYIQMGDGTEMEFQFRMAAGRGLDFGTMTLANGQVRTFTGFNGYHFGWVDENGDGINDNFSDADGDGICDQGRHFAGYAYHMNQGYVDANNDGLNDHFIDENGDGINDLNGRSYGFGFGFIDDNPKDGINDRFVDADGDGICDLTGMPYQHPFGWSDGNSDGVNDRFTDVDGDGINDVTGTPYVAMPGWADLDGNERNDFFADANGDGVNDLGTVTAPYGHGYGWVDENGDGINDRFIDADGDGLNDLASGPFAGHSSSYGYMAGYQDANGDGIDDVSGMPYRQGFGWVDNDVNGVNDVFADAEGDGVNDYFGFHYDGGGYHMSLNFNSPMDTQNPTWPMGPGGGMMN